MTHGVFLIGVLAIAGFPPFSGFFSKDEILLAAYAAHQIPGHQWLWAIGLVTAALTAFYMFRLYFLIFCGECRADARDARAHIHEAALGGARAARACSPCFSVVAGFVGLPQVYGDLLGVPDSNSLGNFLRAGAAAAASTRSRTRPSSASPRLAVGAATLGRAAGVRWLYVWRPGAAGAHRARRSAALSRCCVENKYYVDELYDALIVRPLVARLGQACSSASSTRG